MKLFIFLIPIFLFNFNIHAEINPNRTRFDNRLKFVSYNPDDVTNIFTKIGFTTLIKLSPAERVDKSGGLALGDPNAWNISARENNIFIRPIADDPETNLTIVTNKRTYFFNLRTTTVNNNVTWGIKFLYPDDKSLSKQDKKPCSNSNVINFNYMGKGNKNLIPVTAFDDGQFTCFVMQDNVDLPIVFKKMPDNSEMLVNFHVQGNTIVIHETYSEFRIRLGSQVAGVKNNEFDRAGK